MLDEFVKLTGYSRCYASYVLRTYGKKVVVDSKDGKRTVFIGDDLDNGRGMKLKKRKRKRIYDEKVSMPLSTSGVHQTISVVRDFMYILRK